MNRQIISRLALLLSAFMPAIASAQGFEDLLRAAIRMVGLITPVMFTLALVFFVWAGIGLIRADEDSRADRKQQLLWGVIAMFVIFSIWGITKFIGRTFNIGQDTTIPAPRGFTPGS